MHILLTHNSYASTVPSGEDQVMNAERALLQARDHTVSGFTRHSDTIRARGAWGTVQGAFSTPWNPFAAKAMRRTLDVTRPDVVHVHNTFPLISPAIFHTIGLRAARVLTLHNYRLFCPAAIPMRAGKVCTDCLDRRNVLPAVKHGCYRGSHLATLPLAVNVALHRFLGTWTNQVDAFIALSEFQRERMVEAGLPASRVHVKPNFYPGCPRVVPWPERPDYVVFVGRLSEEKGVHTLLRAWKAWGAGAPELRIVGDGPLRGQLESLAEGLSVRFLGQVPFADAQAQIASARLLVLPSEWFEGFPMVVREAFAFGTPTAVSNLGPLPSIVKHGESGVVFGAASADSLLNAVRAVWRSPSALEQLGKGARLAFEEHYNEDSNYQTLMQIYEQAISENKRQRV